MASGTGEQLREARYDKGVTLSDAAREIGVRETHLLALERDELELIGIDPVYVRGILRTYADYLGLRSADMLARYDAQVAPHAAGGAAGATGTAAPSSRTTDAPPPHRSSRRRIGTIVGAILTIAIVSAATLAVLNLRRGPEDDEAVATSDAQPAAATASAQPSETTEDASEDAAARAIPQGPAPDELTMKLEFTDEVWVRVRVDGENKLEGLMRPGAVTQFTGKKRIDLRVGVAEAVEFSLNGAWYGNIASDLDGPVNVRCTPKTSCRVTQDG